MGSVGDDHGGWCDRRLYSRTMVSTSADIKSDLQRYLQRGREALLWKLEGLPERELRMPRTPTGLNLLGIVKHVANCEIGYFGDTFDRAWPTPEERVSEAAFEVDPQADWYVTESEGAADVVDLYRRVWAFADETIDSLAIDAPGTVPWWPAGRNEITLGKALIHVLTDVTRHAGHADLIRESIDGAVGLQADGSNVPDYDWPAYVTRLIGIAERF